MRAAAVLVSLTGLLAACMSDPHLELFEAAGPTTQTSPTTPSAPGTEREPDAASSADAAADVGVTPPVDDDASAPPPPPPPPPTMTCPPAGAPAGTQCCGANGAAPPCIGMACEHCGDCVARGCAVGMICCADSPGQSGKYKGMTCRAAALAGTCPL